MNTELIKENIIKNAKEITALKARIDETFKSRGQSNEKKAEWSQACAEFHSRYPLLAFPGGYGGALEKIAAGDKDAMEAGICFLELRPYFFRSGYMFKDILKKCKKAPLSDRQKSRLDDVMKKIDEWKKSKF